mmetsp:Transcript_6189/g.15024  ORF Transcript_6189/g.15024 Transcript_6189/m.15024 type:complete len:236 (-) Transcript_6189:144-851(-)
MEPFGHNVFFCIGAILLERLCGAAALGGHGTEEGLLGSVRVQHVAEASFDLSLVARIRIHRGDHLAGFQIFDKRDQFRKGRVLRIANKPHFHVHPLDDFGANGILFVPIGRIRPSGGNESYHFIILLAWCITAFVICCFRVFQILDVFGKLLEIGLKVWPHFSRQTHRNHVQVARGLVAGAALQDGIVLLVFRFAILLVLLYTIEHLPFFLAHVNRLAASLGGFIQNLFFPNRIT